MVARNCCRRTPARTRRLVPAVSLVQLPAALQSTQCKAVGNEGSMQRRQCVGLEGILQEVISRSIALQGALTLQMPAEALCLSNCPGAGSLVRESRFADQVRSDGAVRNAQKRLSRKLLVATATVITTKTAGYGKESLTTPSHMMVWFQPRPSITVIR